MNETGKEVFMRMSLDTLSDKIAEAAKEEADSIIAEAKAEAKRLKAAAKEEAKNIAEQLKQNAEREATQLGTEMSAAARQHNQKQILIAKREQLDSTWEALFALVGSAAMKRRTEMLKLLLKSAAKEPGKMVLRPVAFDRKVIEKNAGKFTVGDDIEGLGGFILESDGGAVSLDFRFESRLQSAWDENLGAVAETLFS